jgi:HK97 gp10 family phage protein
MIRADVKRLKKMDPRLLEKVTDEFLWTAALDVSADAKLRAPVDQGRLRDSITAAVKDRNERPGSRAQSGDEVDKPSANNEAFVGTNVEYAIYQEFGTAKMSAQPFLRKAIDSQRRRLKRIFSDKIREALRRG